MNHGDAKEHQSRIWQLLFAVLSVSPWLQGFTVAEMVATSSAACYGRLDVYASLA